MLASSPLDPLYYAIGWVLALFYAPFKSLGLAIILLTIVVMLVQFPLIAKQTRSMIQMQRVQPEIKRIQAKYKDDKAKQNEELLKFYQENKINPLAGCLPILVTIPIGLAVFRTFNEGVQRHIPRSGALSGLYTDLCGKTASLAECTTKLDEANNSGHTPKTLRFLTMNLDWSAHEVQKQLPGEYLRWLPYFLIIAAVIFTGWYQVRQTQARQQKQGGQAPNAQMQMITRVMPIFFGVITYGLNAATTIYFVVSNTWRIGQQHFVLSKMYEEEHQKDKTKEKPVDEAPSDGDTPPDTNGKGTPPKPKPIPGASGSKGPAPRDANGSGNSSGNGGTSSGARRKNRKKKR